MPAARARAVARARGAAAGRNRSTDGSEIRVSAIRLVRPLNRGRCPFRVRAVRLRVRGGPPVAPRSHTELRY